MKIAQVTHLFPPLQGGIEHHVYELSKELALLGNEVTVYTTKVKGAPDHEELFAGHKAQGAKAVLVRRFWSINLPGFSSVRFSPGMFLALIGCDADLFAGHGYGSPMPIVTSIAAWLKGKPFFFTLHGYPDLKGLGGIFQKMYKWFCASVFLRIAKKVIVVSKNSIRKIEKEVPKEKIAYIPNGVAVHETDSFVNKKYITYIGRLDSYKGIDRLIKAVGMLRQNPTRVSQRDTGPLVRYAGQTELKTQNFLLRIVGPDEGIRQGLIALAKKEAVNTEFLEVPYSEISRIYKESMCVVLPSLYEGFSLVWLEAMAAGRPMFSTPVGDAELLFGSAYGKNAHKFLFKDEKELAQKLQEFLEYPSEYVKPVSLAKDYVDRTYSWGKIAQTTLQVYNESTK